MPTYCSEGNMVGMQAAVLVPLLVRSLEEEAHGDPLVPDLPPLEHTVLSAWLYSFQ
jgi:hypothetical protein